MCRNIKVLRREDGSPSDAELRDAALQYIRKLRGYRKPSRVNEAAFERAVNDVADVTRRMFDALVVKPAGRSAGNAQAQAGAQA